MTPPLTEAEIEEFEAAGAICLRQRFDMGWVERLRAAVDRSLEAERRAREDPEAKRFEMNHHLVYREPDVRAFVFESPAAGIARALMRSRTARFYIDHVFVKEPGVEAPTPWHHDQPYWPVRGRQVCSIWLALDPVTKQSSGLEYVRGSHRWGKEYAPVPFTERGAAMRQATDEQPPDFDGRRNEFEFLNWDMEPGDCLAHQALAIHGASGNTTRTQRRRAFSTRWTGDDARYREPAHYMDPNLVDLTLRDGERLESMKFPLVLGARP